LDAVAKKFRIAPWQRAAGVGDQPVMNTNQRKLSGAEMIAQIRVLSWISYVSGATG